MVKTKKIIVLSCLVSAAAVLFFSGCKHKTDITDPELKLSSLKICGEKEKDGVFSVSADKITAADIEAEFTYGKTVKPEKIGAVLESASIALNGTEEKKVLIKVEAVKGKHKAWSKTVKVKKNTDPELNLVSLTVCGRSEVNEIFTVDKDVIEASDIDAKFTYGTLTIPEKIDVTVEGAPITLSDTDYVKVVMRIEGVKGKYASWGKRINVKKENSKPVDPNLQDLLDTIHISGGEINGETASNSTPQDADNIKEGKEVTVKIKGPWAKIKMGSVNSDWTSVKINGTSVPVKPMGGLFGLKSAAEATVDLPAKGESLSVNIEIKENAKTALCSFKIKRIEGAIDMPKLYLHINGIYPFAETDKRHLERKLYENFTLVLPGYEPTLIRVDSAFDLISGVKINGQFYAAQKRTDNPGTEYEKNWWQAEGSISGVEDSLPNSKEITIVIEPKNPDDYETVTWRFKLKAAAKEKLGFTYILNGIPDSKLDEDFRNGIIEGSNPLIEIDEKYLHLKFALEQEVTSLTVNGTETKDKLIKAGRYRILLYSGELNAATEKSVEIIAKPKDAGKFNNAKIKFRAKGSAAKHKLLPQLFINGFGDFPKAAFMDKLTDGSKPLYEVNGSSADLRFTFSSYENDFHISKVNINGEDVQVKFVQEWYPEVLQYYGADKKDIAVNAATPIDVKVIFTPKNAEATEMLTWEFQLKGGGNLPPLPKNKISRFTINNLGMPQNPFPADFTAGLTDGSGPLLTLDSDKAAITIFANEDWNQGGAAPIEKVNFIVDGTSSEVIPEDLGGAVRAAYNISLPDTSEHNVRIEILPKDTSKYSELVYSFKLKNSGLKPEMDLIFVVDRQRRRNGYKAVIKNEYVNFRVQCDKDVMQSVSIDGVNCEIKEFQGSAGKFWGTNRKTEIPTNDYKDFVISVTPKDSTKYRVTTCTFTLKGTAIPDSNAEFIHIPAGPGNPQPYVLHVQQTFTDNLIHKFPDDYGAKTVKLEARTVSRRAKVRYKIIDLEGSTLGAEKEMTHQGFGVHTGEVITLYGNKPAIVKAYVIAENNVTKDAAKGEWTFMYNPVYLRWDTVSKVIGDEFKTAAYDEIKVKTDEVIGNKIYLAFAAWKDDYSVNKNYAYKPYQRASFDTLNTIYDKMQWYGTEIDISALIDGKETELEAAFPILDKNNFECFTYKVKIKLAQ